MKSLDVSIPIWGYSGVVLQGGTSFEFAEWAAKEYDCVVEPMEDETGRIYFCPGEPFLLWVQTLKDVPTLAHECLHVVLSVLQDRGMILASPSEEAYTYTLEHLLRSILTAKVWKIA